MKDKAKNKPGTEPKARAAGKAKDDPAVKRAMAARVATGKDQTVSVSPAPTTPASKAEPGAQAVAGAAAPAVASPAIVEKPVPVKGPANPEKAKRTVPVAAKAGPRSETARSPEREPAAEPAKPAPAEAAAPVRPVEVPASPKVVPLPTPKPAPAPAAPAAAEVRPQAGPAEATPAAAAGTVGVGLDQARAGFLRAQESGEAFRKALLESTTATTRGLVEINTKMLDLVRAQNDAALALWRSTVSSGSLSEAIRNQTSGARQAYETTAVHWKDIAETTGRVVGDIVKPLQAAWTPKAR